MPDFGEDDGNVKRRLKIFHTTSLPQWQMRDGVKEMYQENPMEYIHWIADTLNANVDVIPLEERFYERIPIVKETPLEQAVSAEVEVLRTAPFSTLLGCAQSATPGNGNNVHQVHTHSPLYYSPKCHREVEWG